MHLKHFKIIKKTMHCFFIDQSQILWDQHNHSNKRLDNQIVFKKLLESLEIPLWYEVSLCIQSKCGKIQTRKFPVFGHFSRSVLNSKIFHNLSIVTLAMLGNKSEIIYEPLRSNLKDLLVYIFILNDKTQLLSNV